MEICLIPEFCGDATQNVVECLAKAERVCNLRGIAHLESAILLRLTGGAFARRNGRRDSGGAAYGRSSVRLT